jgi:hypothetical protein
VSWLLLADADFSAAQIEEILAALGAVVLVFLGSHALPHVVPLLEQRNRRVIGVIPHISRAIIAVEQALPEPLRDPRVALVIRVSDIGRAVLPMEAAMPVPPLSLGVSTTRKIFDERRPIGAVPLAGMPPLLPADLTIGSIFGECRPVLPMEAAVLIPCFYLPPAVREHGDGGGIVRRV